MLFAKWMFWMWMLEEFESSHVGDEPAGLKIPAELRSDFADLFNSYFEVDDQRGAAARPRRTRGTLQSLPS